MDGGADVNARGRLFPNALIIASSQDLEEVAKLLLEHGTDVEAEARNRALSAASLKGHEEVIRSLLDRGTDTNEGNMTINSALEAVSSNGHEKVVKLLLERGADVNV